MVDCGGGGGRGGGGAGEEEFSLADFRRGSCGFIGCDCSGETFLRCRLRGRLDWLRGLVLVFKDCCRGCGGGESCGGCEGLGRGGRSLMLSSKSKLVLASSYRRHQEGMLVLYQLFLRQRRFRLNPIPREYGRLTRSSHLLFGRLRCVRTF